MSSPPALRPSIDELVAADPPEAWERAGFLVEDGECRIGTVRLRLAGSEGGGLVGWSLRGIETTELDGLPTTISRRPPPEPPPGEHPNGTVAIDHVVAFSPDLDRTAARLHAAGLDLRRVREEPTPAGAPRQAFFRLGEVILEVIQQPEGAERLPRARLWGLALRVRALEEPAALLGDRLGSPRPAVQPGRTIATVRRSAGLSVPVAFMTPPPAAAPTI